MNGFAIKGAERVKEKKYLSIPLNGFKVGSLVEQYRTVYLTFNSIEWILCLREKGEVEKTVELSIPLNGFSFSL